MPGEGEQEEATEVSILEWQQEATVKCSSSPQQPDLHLARLQDEGVPDQKHTVSKVRVQVGKNAIPDRELQHLPDSRQLSSREVGHGVTTLS